MQDKHTTPEGIPIGSNRLAEPVLIALIYGLWLGIQGNSWWWLIGAIVMTFAAIQVLIMRQGHEILIQDLEKKKIPKAWILVYIYQFFKILLLVPATFITLRLAFYSGFWGLYQSVIQVDILGIAIAIIALYMGSRMSPHYKWFVNL